MFEVPGNVLRDLGQQAMRYQARLQECDRLCAEAEKASDPAMVHRIIKQMRGVLDRDL
jgi:hypothetical protein